MYNPPDFIQKEKPSPSGRTMENKKRPEHPCPDLLYRNASVRMNFRHFFLEEQIVQRAERAVFFHLVDGHFVSVDGQFDKAAPAIILMGADFPYILRIAVRTS
jgi:hypothetical protein